MDLGLDGPAAGPRRIGQGPPPRWLLAAAAAVVALAGVGLVARLAARSDGDGGFDAAPPPLSTSTVPGPTTASPSTTVTTGPLTTTTVFTPAPVFELGPPVELGSGSVVGFSSDGRFAYVNDVNPRGDVGCEGQGGSLFVQPVTGTGRTEVVELAGAAGYQVVTGPSGQIALLLYCDGRLSQFWVGTIGPDGVPADLRQIRSGANSSLEFLDYLDIVQWSVDGTALLLVEAGFGVDPLATRFDIATGTSTELGLGPVVYLAQDRAGRLAVVTSEGQIRYDGQTVGAVTLLPEESVFEPGVRGVTGLAVDSQGAVWVATTGQGVQRITPGGPMTSIDPTATHLFPLPDGILWVTTTGTVRTLRDGSVVDLGTTGGLVDPGGTVVGDTVWDGETATAVVAPLDRTG